MENLLLLSVSLNTDIFEANLINIVLLVVLLFNVVGDALKTSMLERKEKILSGVQDAEQR
jgi:F0F1-type ATP synthase membrane subunit b/b'